MSKLFLLRRVSTLAVLLAAVPAMAQQLSLWPDCIIFLGPTGSGFTATGTSANFDNRNTGCNQWTITYNSRGFTAVTLAFESAPNAVGDVPGAFVNFAGTIITGINPNTSITQVQTKFDGYFPWLRVNLSAVTGSGVIYGMAYGKRVQSTSVSLSGNVTVVGPDAPGVAPTANPVQVGIFDGTNVRRLRGDTLGRLEVGGACVSNTPVSLTASGNTQIIAAVGGQEIRVCHISLGATSALNIKLTRGTGVNCATGTADVSGFYNNITSLALDLNGTLRIPIGEALCVNQSAAVVTGGLITFNQAVF